MIFSTGSKPTLSQQYIIVVPGADRGEAYLAEQIASVLSQLSEAAELYLTVK